MLRVPEQLVFFLDPPYPSDEYYGENYEFSESVFGDVVKWCKENKNNEYLRIALCGYTGNGVSDTLEQWERWDWSRNGGYANRGDKKENKHRECIWFSPSCKKVGQETLL